MQHYSSNTPTESSADQCEVMPASKQSFSALIKGPRIIDRVKSNKHRTSFALLLGETMIKHP